MLLSNPTLDVVLQNTYSPEFEVLYLPSGPWQSDHRWLITIRILDVYWSTRIVRLPVEIGTGAFIVNNFYHKINIM